MTLTQSAITIGLIVLGTMITRFLPFILFPAHKETPAYIKYLSAVLPYAVMGLLIVFCLKDTSFTSGAYGLPEISCILITALLHLWKKNMLLSIAVSTLLYMFLVQVVFI